MEELSERQWSGVAPRLTNRACAICGEHHISREPRYVEVNGVDMLITTCDYCGHIELFDVAELAKIADIKHANYVKEGLRKP